MEKFLAILKKKNEHAKRELYERYGKKLYGYAVSKWKVNEDDAWELIYKTIDNTVETFDRYSFENESKFAGFIFKMFMNYLRNHYRDNKNKRPETVSLDENIQHSADNQEPLSEEAGPDSENMRLLREELDKLEDWQRILLLMRAQDYSYGEIAAFINKPADQLKVYYMRYKQAIIKNINARIKSA